MLLFFFFLQAHHMPCRLNWSYLKGAVYKLLYGAGNIIYKCPDEKNQAVQYKKEPGNK